MDALLCDSRADVPAAAADRTVDLGNCRERNAGQNR